MHVYTCIYTERQRDGQSHACSIWAGMAGMFMDENMGLSLLESIDDDFLSQAVFASQARFRTEGFMEAETPHVLFSTAL